MYQLISMHFLENFAYLSTLSICKAPLRFLDIPEQSDKGYHVKIKRPTLQNICSFLPSIHSSYYYFLVSFCKLVFLVLPFSRTFLSIRIIFLSCQPLITTSYHPLLQQHCRVINSTMLQVFVHCLKFCNVFCRLLKKLITQNKDQAQLIQEQNKRLKFGWVVSNKFRISGMLLKRLCKTRCVSLKITRLFTGGGGIP